MFEIGIEAALVLLGMGLRSFCHLWLHRLGLLLFAAATFMAGYFLGCCRIWTGLLALAVWPLLPLLEIVWRVRRMKFPLQTIVTQAFAPSGSALPELEEMSREFEKAGFVPAEDVGWKWHEVEHFMRILYHPQDKIRASIMVSRKPRAEINYVSLSSDTPSGETFVSWTFPLSYPLKFPPELRIQKICHASDVEDLVEQHRMFLQQFGWENSEVKDQQADAMASNVEKELKRQVDYNLEQGLIEKAGAAHFRYSWRGCLFLWLRTLGDMVRFL